MKNSNKKQTEEEMLEEMYPLIKSFVSHVIQSELDKYLKAQREKFKLEKGE